MVKRIGVLFLAFAIIFGFAACSSPAPSGSAAPSATAKPAKTTVNIALPADPGSFNPMGAAGNDSFAQVATQIYDRLYIFDNNMKEVPQLAESWEKKDDVTWVFKLRKGVKFSDGSDFKASDVLFTLQLCKDDKTNGLIVQLMDWSKTKVIDDNTIQIAYTEPNAVVFGQLQSVFITSEKAYKASPDQMKTKPIGTGPYTLKEWVTGSSLTLVANPNYWGEKPKIQTIVYKVIPDASQRTNALLAGNVDLALNVQPSDIETIKKDPKLTAAVQSKNSNDSFFMNTTEYSVLKNADLRKAIAYSVDKAGIQKAAYSGLGKLATANVPSFFKDYDKAWASKDYYSYNIDKAKEYFAKSKVPAGTTLTIISNGGKEQMIAAQIIQAGIQKLGLNAKIVTYDPSVFSKNAMDAKGGWDIAMWSTGSPNFIMPDLFNAYILNLGVSGYKPDAFVTAIKTALKQTDLAKMAPYTKQVYDMLVNDLPHFSYMETPLFYGYTNDLQGYSVWSIHVVPVRLLSFK